MIFTIILVPKGFDLDCIDKCFVDVRAQFTFVEDLDSEIKTREGQHFCVLQKEYFTVYTRQYREGVKCGYQSRNMVMSHNSHFFWHQYNNLMRSDSSEQIKEGEVVLSVTKVNDLFIWKEPPLMYFVSKKDIGNIFGNETEENTVVVYFDESSIKEFAQTVKFKKNVCKHTFIVYLGNDEYQCFNTDDITINYKYGGRLKARVVKMVRKDVNNITKLIKEEEQLPKKRPKTERDAANFKLVDINGNEVDGNERYFLKIRQEGEDDEVDRRGDHDVLEIIEGITAGIGTRDLEVTCEIVNGIDYKISK
jgi:hypothetical protein